MPSDNEHLFVSVEAAIDCVKSLYRQVRQATDAKEKLQALNAEKRDALKSILSLAEDARARVSKQDDRELQVILYLIEVKICDEWINCNTDTELHSTRR